MSSNVEDIRRWRELAEEVRIYAKSMRSEAARAEMIAAAENWEKQAAEAEAALKEKL